MDRATKIAAAGGVIGALVMGTAIWWSVTSEQRTFDRNASTIAAGVAEHEAMKTPEQRQAEQAAAARAARAKAEAEARERFLPSSRGACLLALKRTLHDPDSAEFGLTSEWPSKVGVDGRAHIMARIRAVNGFGALRLTTFLCEVERVGINQVRVVKLEQVP